MVQAGVFKDDERVELVDGALLLMPPQSAPHAATTAGVRDVLAKAYGEAWHARDHSPVVAGPTNMPEPDVAIVRGEIRDYKAHHPAGTDTAVVVEVARVSMRQARRKRTVYARGGFPVYLLIDIEKRVIEAHFGPTPQGTYERVDIQPIPVSDLLV